MNFQYDDDKDSESEMIIEKSEDNLKDQDQSSQEYSDKNDNDESLSSVSNLTDDYESDDQENIRNQSKEYIEEDSDELELLYEGFFEDRFDDTGNWRAVQSTEAFDNNFTTEMPIPKFNENQVNLNAISQDLIQNPTAIGCFQLYYTEQVLQELANQSNIYKQQTFKKLRDKNFFIKRYIQLHTQEDFSVEDMLVYHILLLAISIIQLDNFKKLWSLNPFLSLPISSLIARDKFQVIDKFFHIANNEQIQNGDGVRNQSLLYKIRPIIDLINTVSQRVWLPNLALCIDEAVEPFKGRSKLILYHPQKPHKWGIRLYILTCAASAFTLNIEVCLGKQEEGDNKIYNLVLRMTELYQNQGYILAMDNLYSMIALFQRLADLKFRAMGTIRTNRLKLTNQQKENINFDKLKGGQFVSIIQQNLHVLFWKAKDEKEKLVQVLNNFFGIEFDLNNQDNVNLKQLISQQGVNCDSKTKPLIVEMYNKFTHGTDRRNQLLESHRINKKNRKQWKTLYQGLFNCVIVNSWKIYQELTQKSIDHRKYREILLDQLIKAYNEERYNQTFNRQKEQQNPYRTALNHYSCEQKVQQNQTDQKNQSDNLKKRNNNKRICVACDERTREICNSCVDKNNKNKGLHYKCTHKHQSKILDQLLKIHSRQ